MARRLASVVVIIAVGIGIYYYTRLDASTRVKATLLEGVSMMELSAADAAYVRRQVEAVHPAAFDMAMTATAREGKKFNGPLYFEEVKRGVLERAAQEGRQELAAKLVNEFAALEFEVEER
jgi:hypothetical protein